MFSGYSRRRRDGGSEPGGQGEGRAAGVRHGTGLAALSRLVAVGPQPGCRRDFGPLPADASAYLDRGYDSSLAGRSMRERGLVETISEKRSPSPLRATETAGLAKLDFFSTTS